MGKQLHPVSDAVEKYPESNVANALMGVVYMDLEWTKKRQNILKKRSRFCPIDYESRNNLGIVYQKLNRPEKGPSRVDERHVVGNPKTRS